MTLRIGSRGSKLALTQTNLVADAIRAANPGLEVDVVIIKTKVDLIQDKPLNEIGDKGLFVKEIEEALLNHEIDLAVHSLKDMPGEQPPGLEMSITPKREDPRDVVITFEPMKSLENLPLNSKIATGSPRRIDQLKILRPDITAMPIRGNVDTRIRKSKENGYQGIILAAAGLNRLNMEYTGFPLEIDTFIPAPAQGILGLENRVDDEETLAYLRPLHDEDSHRQALAERAFLRYVDGGCHAPMGGHCVIGGENFTITGFYQEGEVYRKESLCGVRGEESEKGKALALLLKERVKNER